MPQPAPRLVLPQAALECHRIGLSLWCWRSYGNKRLLKRAFIAPGLPTRHRDMATARVWVCYDWAVTQAFHLLRNLHGHERKEY